MNLNFATAILLFTAATAVAGPYASIRFAAKADLSNVGISLPLPQNAKAEPVRPVEVFRYSCTRGAESWTEDRVDPKEFWRAEQQLGDWSTPARGNAASSSRVIFAKALWKYPSNFTDEHVTRETFRDWADAPEHMLAEDATPNELATWMARFCGTRVQKDVAPQKVQVNASRLGDVWRIPLVNDAMCAWMFRLNSHAPGASRAPSHWFALVYIAGAAPANANDRKELEHALRYGLMAEIRTTGMYAEAKVQSRLSKHRRFSKARNIEIPDDDARRAAHASVDMLEAWWSMDSPHYVLLSDDPGAEMHAEKILDILESTRPHFEAVFPPLEGALQTTAVVRLFGKPQDYINYLSAGGGSPIAASQSAGLYDGGRRELVIRPITKDIANTLENTLRHEGFHQYIHAAWGGLPMSTWLNEGAAQVFGSYKNKGTFWQVPEDETAAKFLRELAKRLTAEQWAKLVHGYVVSTHEGFYNSKAIGGVRENYMFAYGLGYFLLRGAPVMRNKPYAEFFDDYLSSLLQTRNPQLASVAACKLGAKGAPTEAFRAFARDTQNFWANDGARQAAARAKVP